MTAAPLGTTGRTREAGLPESPPEAATPEAATPETATPETATPETVVDVKGLWKIFGEREAEALRACLEQGLSKSELLERYDCILGVADASFQVRRGEIFCIMGLSGSGKSTLLRHLNRLIRPSAGAIDMLGTDILALGEAELRQMRATRIGMVFQHMALMPHWTVRENVMFPLQVQGLSKAKIWEVAQRTLSLVDLGGYEGHAPDQLSGGMKQRVGLARALASDPAILLMDEPFSALDPLIRRQLQDLFLELSRRLHKTAIFITHDLDEAIRLGDRIAIMKNGRIVQSGQAREIVFNPADDYVADFVQDLSRIKFVTVDDVMRPLAELPPGSEATLVQAPRIRQTASVEDVVRTAIGVEGVLVVEDESGQDIGFLTKDDLLLAIAPPRD